MNEGPENGNAIFPTGIPGGAMQRARQPMCVLRRTPGRNFGYQGRRLSFTSISQTRTCKNSACRQLHDVILAQL